MNECERHKFASSCSRCANEEELGRISDLVKSYQKKQDERFVEIIGYMKELVLELQGISESMEYLASEE